MAGAAAVLLLMIAVMTPAVRTQAYVWPDRELGLGMTGEDVLSLQTRLAELGYDAGGLDGYFGEYTQVALMYYQYYNNLYVDGVAGPITLAALYGTQNTGANDAAGTSEVHLINGSAGSDVMTLQNRLEELGYATGGVDGIFGNQTEAAVIAFQRANGLYADGIVGPLTVAALKSSSAVRGGSSNPANQSSNNASAGSTARELRRGMTGSDVQLLQSALDSLGFATGGADGDFGAKTEAAVKAFQTAKGLLADGIVGPITLAALSGAVSADQGTNNGNAASTRELKKGMTGEDVKTLQNRLKTLGFYSGSVDGDFGSMTEAAVKAFQTAKGLLADGIAGPITLAALAGSNEQPQVSSPAQPQGEWLEGSVMEGALSFDRTLGNGMTGSDVEKLQQRLFDLGYLDVSPTGVFGDMTEAALKAFQADHGLYADGLVGYQTLEALNWRHFLDEPVTSELADSVILTEKSYSREGQEIRFIIPHHMAARNTGAGCAEYFTYNTVGTSANYCIGYGGDIAQNVPEQYGAWTSGDVNFDRQAITIEVSDTAGNDYRIPQAAQDAFVDLCVDLVRRYPSLGGKLVYDTEDEARVIAAKYGTGSWDAIRGNVLIHCWTTTTGTTCPEWHMQEILPDLIDRINSRLQEPY